MCLTCAHLSSYHFVKPNDTQHWHVYRKWNERLLREMYNAYLKGHSPNDPTENWYKGEIGFFDFYIIPLAKKLKECGVFGKSSDEYLGYAQQVRDEARFVWDCPIFAFSFHVF